MFTDDRPTGKISWAIALYLAMVPVTEAADDPCKTLLPENPTNHQIVVANMTIDFLDFGLSWQQAQMLAEQTADFGTLGAMTTVAAVGISLRPRTFRDRVGACVCEPLAASTVRLVSNMNATRQTNGWGAAPKNEWGTAPKSDATQCVASRTDTCRSTGGRHG